MKIICVGRNYGDHIKELGNEKPEAPVVFLKPDTALLKDNAPFYYPSFSKEIHFEVELVLKIGKEGKFIQKNFASKYIDSIGLGIDFTARDVQNYLKSKGLPWEIAKGFNGSAVVSDFIPFESDNQIDEAAFALTQNGVTKQNGFASDMIHHWKDLLVFISQYFTLKKGDLIYTGTPAGVGPVQIGDELKGFLNTKEMFTCVIK